METSISEDLKIFRSINPFNGEELATYREQSMDEIDEILTRAGSAFEAWKSVPLERRSELMNSAAAVLTQNVERYSRTMTMEMGKPIRESRAEIKKCVWVCRYYAENAGAFLADDIIKTDADESFVRHEPIGPVLAIMPWNFPFWQVLRFAAPALMAGNTALLKHASNVFGCASHIEEVFREAGFPDAVFQNLFIHHDKAEYIIASDAVRAVTLTGSERAGRSVGSLAGKYLKRSVLELGGNNAFIVLEDADMKSAVETGVKARMLNAGQSCIAAKRFILVGSTYDRFLPEFVDRVRSLAPGDPLDDSTEIGPMAKRVFADELHRQVQQSVEMGAKILTGGHKKGAYFEPTVISDVRPGMPVFDEETFGPTAAIIRAKDEAEAFSLAVDSNFGLGVTVFTRDIERAKELIGVVPDGAFFINELVKSDPRLPFGGSQNSGYGRELSKDGMMEFINRKTVYVKRGV